MFTIYIGVGFMSDIRVLNPHITLFHPRLLITNPVVLTVVYMLASVYVMSVPLCLCHYEYDG